MDSLQDLFENRWREHVPQGGEGAGGPKDPIPDVGGGKRERRAGFSYGRGGVGSSSQGVRVVAARENGKTFLSGAQGFNHKFSPPPPLDVVLRT